MTDSRFYLKIRGQFGLIAALGVGGHHRDRDA
jgi:hypothetical protein